MLPTRVDPEWVRKYSSYDHCVSDSLFSLVVRLGQHLHTLDLEMPQYAALDRKWVHVWKEECVQGKKAVEDVLEVDALGSIMDVWKWNWVRCM